MDRKSAENLDRIHAMNWLYEVFLCPRKAFYDYSDEEIQETALDAVILLNKDRKERSEIAHEMMENSILMYRGRELVQCKDCVYGMAFKNVKDEQLIDCMCPTHNEKYVEVHNPDWFCADGKRKEGTSKCY